MFASGGEYLRLKRRLAVNYYSGLTRPQFVVKQALFRSWINGFLQKPFTELPCWDEFTFELIHNIAPDYVLSLLVEL